MTYCPLCGDETETDDIERFGMCVDCFADSLRENVCDSVLYDFLKEYQRELKDFIYDNYES